ncbi:MAG: L-threonylcarbamoyladenylate synthase, partial [Persicimonas sp.]
MSRSNSEKGEGATVIEVDAERPDAEALAPAARALAAGKLVAFPTETVYGLGANALDEEAVAAIFEAKRRPATNPLIVHAANLAQVRRLVDDWPERAQRLADAFWPGPLTLVLEKSAEVPDRVTAGLATVAVRIPQPPVARLLIELAGVPVAAPSANRYTEVSPTRADHVLESLGDRVDFIVDAGPTSVGVESTIVSLTSDPPRVLRPGMIGAAVLNDIGPEIGTAGLARIMGYAGKIPVPADWNEAVELVRQINERFFTDMSAEDWETLARQSFNETEDGRPAASYDPRIAKALSQIDISKRIPDMWAHYEALSDVPLMILRGENT